MVMIFNDSSSKASGMKLRIANRSPIGEVRDLGALGVVVAVRVVRAMVLWIAVYFIDRAYQEAYVQRVLVDKTDPPKLWKLAAAALAIEAVVTALVGTILYLLSTRFKAPGNAFLLDGPLMRRLALDYVTTTSVMLSLGVAMGMIAQSPRNFRYREDGMRGIRALCVVFLLTAFAVLGLLP